MSAPTAFVYVDLRGTPYLVGRLWTSAAKGRELATFQYDPAWLAHPERFALQPALQLEAAPHHTTPGHKLFGALGDSAPDRWGRTLLRLAERRRATREGKRPRTLFEIDYLLGVTDDVRAGALRFARAEGGPFLQESTTGDGVPPLVRLPDLLAASTHVQSHRETAADVRLLLAPGSSLGGARPKASVRDKKGNLLIAKFPAKGDDVSVERWESLALTLARRAQIDVPNHRLERIDGQDALLVGRFDREASASSYRIPFLSAMSALDAADHDTRSYVEIATVLRQCGAAPSEDLRALWRRLVFNILISNTDDHLRNHGFLYRGPNGWRLSPAYDLNPVPVDRKPRILTTAVTPDGDPTASLDLAFEAAPQFTLNAAEARRIAAEVGKVVVTWRKVAVTLGAPAWEIDHMSSAFEHDDLARARAA